MKIPSNIATLLIGIALTLISLWYGQNHGLLPEAASEEASLVDNLFNAMMTISIGLFLLVQGIILYSAIAFRRRQGDDTDGPPVHGNIPLEILWTALPAIIVLGISVYSFDVYNQMGGINPMEHGSGKRQDSAQVQTDKSMAQMSGVAIAAPLPGATEAPPEVKDRNEAMQEEALQDPATANVRNDEIPQLKEATGAGVVAPKVGSSPDRQGLPPELVVNVTGLQYAWIFTYPDSGITSGELHMPIGREVMLNISANDVLHAFWVPEFRLKQDAVPGRQGELRFTPSKVGEYPVICAELCGPYHGAMRTKAIVHTLEEYDSWVQSQVASKGVPSNTIAVNSVDLSPSDFLAPFVKDLGIDSDVLEQVHPSHHHHAT